MTLQGWAYCVDIAVTNSLAQDLDYQVEVVLPSNFPYDSVAFDDGRDFRVTDENDNVLPYWIEAFDRTNKKGIIWFRATLPANSTRSLSCISATQTPQTPKTHHKHF